MTIEAGEFQSNREIFLAALELEDPQERLSLVARICGADVERRQQLERLLAAAGDDVDSPLDLAIRGLQLAAKRVGDDTPAIDDATPQSIDRYQLLEQIGEGGMGSVFMAQQTQPVRRVVALKLIKPGMDSREVIRRFEAERQALAMMDHPNIARVLDAGTTTQGRPYFVMVYCQN